MCLEGQCSKGYLENDIVKLFLMRRDWNVVQYYFWESLILCFIHLGSN